MNRELEIVGKIVIGCDPVDGGQALQTPRDYALDKARIIYFEQLKRVCQQGDGKQLPRKSCGSYQPNRHAGATWTAAEDARLLALWVAPEKLTCQEIGECMGRTEGAIIARLVHQGRFPSRNAVREANQQRFLGCASKNE